MKTQKELKEFYMEKLDILMNAIEENPENVLAYSPIILALPKYVTKL